ncbi:MAG: glutamine-hydrolyzing carbamoyl-phosphate synthase small subunit [Proteobacteria bacterium]|nr:glutamine-hydrolyzing carbamoyl-phosphate synthase small subunit [Pseudomonadota bacterium]
MKQAALLVLEDGTVFRGYSCGAQGEAGGELVFNTSLTGYQEVITDPSYKGQLVTMTYPQIGNYGIAPDDHESRKPFLEGFIVREMCKYPSNWQSVMTVEAFLRNHGIPAIEGVDTRALTRRLRDKGALRAILSTSDLDAARLLKKARELPSMAGQDLAKTVTCESPYEWTERFKPGSLGVPAAPAGWSVGGKPPRIVVMDFGAKYGILRCLASMGADVVVVPAKTTADEILKMNPAGLMLSNGPGDPEPVTYAVETIKRILDARLPTFGICLGHQLLGLAMGGKTFKLKFGHHGANHPVMDTTTGKIEITTQNHGFCVDIGSLPSEVKTTHVNLNDQTSEGLMHTQIPAFSVQYHPEACAGPHDARYLFTRFAEMIVRTKTNA